jgi:hypothetical protein
MNESECINPDERYVYDESLAMLNVIDREPNAEEHRMAMRDVKAYRARVSELVEMLG